MIFAPIHRNIDLVLLDTETPHIFSNYHVKTSFGSVINVQIVHQFEDNVHLNVHKNLEWIFQSPV